MIRFPCPSCQMVLQAPEERSGARTTCPRCRQAVQVPAVGGPAGSPAKPLPAAAAPAGNRPVPAGPAAPVASKPTAPGASPAARGTNPPVAAPSVGKRPTAAPTPAAAVTTKPTSAPVTKPAVSAATPPSSVATQPTPATASATAPPTAGSPVSTVEESSEPILLAEEVPGSEKWWLDGWREIKAAALATAAHLAVLAVYVWNVGRRVRLAGEARAAQEALGQGLFEAKLGDPQLQEQVAALEAATAAGGKKDRQAARQRQELLRRLAEPVLAQPAGPPAVQAPWQRAHAAQVALQEQQERLATQRAGLRPGGFAAWRRLLTGYGTLGGATLLVLLVLLPTVDTKPSASLQYSKSGVPEVVVEGTQPDAIPGWVKTAGATSEPVATGEKPQLALDAAGHNSRVTRALFTADSQRVITVSVDKSVRIWDLATGETLQSYRLPMGPGDEGSLYAAALSPDGNLLALGGLPYGRGKLGVPIYLLSLASGQITRVLKGHTNVINALAFSTDGKRLASASGDNTVRIFDVKTGTVQRVLGGFKASVRDVAFAPDGSRLVAASDTSGSIWSASGSQESLLKAEGHPVISVAWSPDGKTVVTGNGDGTMSVYNPDGKLRQLITGLRNQITSVCFTPDSREVLFTGVGFNTANEFGASLVELASGRERIRGQFHKNTVVHGAISPDGKLAATVGGDDSETFVWKTASGEMAQKLVGRGKAVFAVGWSSDGRYIAWGNTNRNNALLEQTFSLRNLDFGPRPDPTYFRADPARGSRSLALGSNFELQVLQNNRLLHVFQPDVPNDRVYCFSWLSDTRAVVGTAQGLYLFEPATNRILRRFRGHSGIILDVAPSADARHFISGGADQTICIWDPEGDEPLFSLFVVEHDWIAWTPAGYYAASPNGERLMGWQINQGAEAVAGFHAAGQFHKSLYHPEVVARLVSAGSLPKALSQAGKKTGELLNVSAVLPPAVTLTAPAGLGSVSVSQSKLEVRATARSTTKHPVTALRLLVNGRPYRGPAGFRPIAQPQLGEVQGSWTVELTPGVYRLSVLAESAVSRGLSPVVELTVAGSSAQTLPDLYVLAVGINEYPRDARLKYAAQDADALAKALREQQGKVFRKVEVKIIKDRAATRTGILKGLQWLASSMTAKDVGLMSFSGHGMRDIGGTFYLIPVEYQGQDPAGICVPGDTIKRALGQMPGRVIAVLDACQSGGSAEDQWNSDDLVRDLVSEDYGVIVMSSSLGREFSLESETVKHGYFTVALLEGLAGKADANRDGTVYLNELDTYAARRVRQLSAGHQNPVTIRPAGIRSFALARP